MVVAPPGYGKTTVLAQWAEQDGRAVAWLTVEEGDNDPATILRHIGLALGHPPHQVTGPPGPDDVAIPRPMDDIYGRSSPVLIVIDDVHHLHGAPMRDLLIQLASQLPPGSQLAVSGRAVPLLEHDRLRAVRGCAQFGPADLAFDAEEAATVLALTGVETARHDLPSLMERTEGWPAGVYLSGLAMADPVALLTAPGQVGGDHVYIADYFRDEVLARQPPRTVRFLLRTAVLGQLSAGLCDAVFETTSSAARLAEIERRNLFVLRLEDHHGWYRYHPLFAEALVAELRRREPGAEQRVHLRAAEWCDGQGMTEQAVGHWIAGGDQLAASRVVHQRGADFIGAGRIGTVRMWLDALGPDAMLAYPAAAVTAAWVWALTGEAESAQHFLLTVERSSRSGSTSERRQSLEAATCLLRAMMCTLGVDRMLVDARRAFDLEPPGTPGHPIAAAVLGIAHLLTGATGRAVQQFEHVVLLHRERRSAEAALALAQLAHIRADQRDWPSADQHAAEAHEMMLALNLQEGVTSALTYLAAARAELHRGQRESARRKLGAAVRNYLNVPPTGFPWLAVQTALLLGEVSLELDDVVAARTRIKDARRHLSRLLTEGALRDRLGALSVAVSQAGGRGGLPSAMALSAAEERVLRLLPTHLSLSEIGDELYISRNTVKGHVAAVYRKLAASTRSDVVMRARQLGLLAE
jgi:LuxR family maltose regulon positive regulatory protein